MFITQVLSNRIDMPNDSLLFRDHDQVRTIFGCQDQHLRLICNRLGVQVVVRGEEIRLSGEAEQVHAGRKVFIELQTILERRGELYPSEVENILDRHTDMSDEIETANGSDPKATLSYSDAVGNSPTTERSSTSVSNRGPRDRQVTPGHKNSVGKNGKNGNGSESNGIDLFEKSKVVRPKTEGQDRYVSAIRKNDLVFCTGPAGCGKTYLAVAMALHALRSERVRRIVLVRPAVEAGEKLGFLPGDMLAKVNPYLRPLLDALADIVSFEQVKRYMEHDIIEIIPLAFMRGRTLNDTFIILDEAQNSTTTQMKMFLTRMGEQSKIVVTGDTTQIDLPPNFQSGLKDAIRRLRKISGVEAVELSGQDIVRHRLVRDIVEAYDDENQNGSRSRRK
jgi:phosphate starvation-inducible protein PhoH and related proteins